MFFIIFQTVQLLKTKVGYLDVYVHFDKRDYFLVLKRKKTDFYLVTTRYIPIGIDKICFFFIL